VTTRAIIFDLDEALLDRRRAWQYAVEESIAAVCGERVSAAELVAEYRLRPWSHALSILVVDRQRQVRCEDVCVSMYERSAMKRLLVHEGIGMGLDRVRAQRVEMGAVSREPHRIAIRQIESTGLDRFLSVLSPTAPGAAWDPIARVMDCCSFLQRAANEVVFVGCDPRDLSAVKAGGIACVQAAYTGCEPGDFGAIQSPATLVELLAGRGAE
jgi:phosphoglycolate phosphatase-like HAD superfamily hydrolase